MWQTTEQKTWYKRLRQFFLENQFTSEFINDVRNFFNHTKTDFVNNQGQFGQDLIEHFKFDEDLNVFFEQVIQAKNFLLEVVDQVGFASEKLLQDYMNKYIVVLL